MKNNNKIRFFSVVAVLLLMVSCVAMFAGCKEKASDITDIIVTSTNQPKLTYVQGQELDLSKGSITVLIDSKERFVPLSADGVSVSGYNKDQLGKQTLTVSYPKAGPVPAEPLTPENSAPTAEAQNPPMVGYVPAVQ